jgi:hypothetical protein
MAILLDKSLTLWSRKENFRYGLKFECDDMMIHVDYLEHCNLWVTVRAHDGAILYWDTNKQKTIETFCHEYLERVNRLLA